MSMTTVDKNLAIASMERVIQDAIEAAGIASFAALESEVAGLRTAFNTNPASVTDVAIGNAATKMQKLRLPSVDDVSGVIDEAQAAVV